MSDSNEQIPPRSTPPEIPPAVTVKPPCPESMWMELSIAINYLTRFNLPFREEPKSRLIRKSMMWFPLVGLLIGIFGAIVEWGVSSMRMPSFISATLAVVGMLWITRALHEEEMATLVNEYGKGMDKDKKIGWLREERTVRYGTIGIILMIIIKIVAIASLADSVLVFKTLIVASAWSRSLMSVVAAWLRPLTGDPVADHFQQPPALRVVLALVFGALIAFIVFREDMATILLPGILAGLVVTLLGANHLRGYNGPLLGMVQQVVEIVTLGIVLAIQ
jgi:adenosylcobinamide-GDP ribazoletransferase